MPNLRKMDFNVNFGKILVVNTYLVLVNAFETSIDILKQYLLQTNAIKYVKSML